MVCAEALELIRAPGGDIAFRIDRSFDDERSRIGGRRRFHPLGQLNLELVPHPGTGRRILQKKVHC